MKDIIHKIFFILDSKAIKQLMTLFVFMIVGSVLEALSIGLILPFIAYANGTLDMPANPLLQSIIDRMPMGGTNNAFLWISIGMFFVYAFKNLFLLALNYYQSRFTYNQQAMISRKLLHAYIYCPYTFHLKRNSSELLRNMTFSMGTVFGNGIMPFMVLMAEIPVLISLSILLLIVDPLITLIAVLFFGGLTGIFYRYVRGKVSYYGDRVQETSTQMILWAKQSIEGIKEIKLFGRANFFLRAFSKYRNENSDVNVFFTLVQRIPRLYLEVVLIGGMLFIMAIVTIRGSDLRSFIPIIGVFAMASIRLLPSINQIVSAMNSIKFGMAAIDDVYKDIKYFREQNHYDHGSHSDEMLQSFSEIELVRLSYVYPGTDRPVLEDINVKIGKGKSVAFVGPSGAGKTTLANVILGLLPQTQGALLVDGKDIYCDKKRTSLWQRSIGFIPQDVYLIDDTLKNNIAFGIEERMINNERVMEVIRQSHLEELVYQLPQGLDTNIGERGVRLSGGQKQRVSIARALYHNPPVLIMDEATSSLDNETESQISRAIDEFSGDKTIIIIAHRLSTIMRCDNIFFIKEGKLIASGTFEELITGNAEFRNMAQYSDLDK
jgi:ATP-binding cassette subfamily C protein